MGNQGEEKIPLDIISYITASFKNCNTILNDKTKKMLVNEIKECLFLRIQNISDREIKEIDKEIIGKVLNEFKDFLNLSLEEI